MARQGLPAKYAKMGFKKGWAAFRAAHRKGHKPHKQKSHHLAGKKTRHHHHTPVHIMHLSGPARKGNTVQISKTRLVEMEGKVKRALAKVREMKAGDVMETAVALGEGAVGAVGSSWLVGVIPVPAKLPKPGAWKAGAQIALGIGLTIPKNKHIRYVGFGTALMGIVSLAREIIPLPMMAGEVDQVMYGPVEVAGGARLGGEEIPAYMGEGSGDPYGG